MAEPVRYEPKNLVSPVRRVDVPTAWDGVEKVIWDILERFDVSSKMALEFGVDYGFSTAALSDFFDVVIGVDTFEGDQHAGYRTSLYERTSVTLARFSNILLLPWSYQEWTARMSAASLRFGMIHIDIVHTFEDTYACGKWAIDHSDVVIFHDTLAFPDVMKAVSQIADESGFYFYNHYFRHGLGILSKKEIA